MTGTQTPPSTIQPLNQLNKTFFLLNNQPISLLSRYFCVSLSYYTFDDITGDRKLWAVHFEGEDDNEFYKVFNNWADVVWLRTFFKENIDDLNAYFKITDIKEAISDTIEDSERLRYIIMPAGQQPGFGYDAAKRKGPVKT